MVFDLVALAAMPAALGASTAIHQQDIFDEEAESESRQAPFYIDIYCDAKSRKRDEVHDSMVVLRDGKVRAASSIMGNCLTDERLQLSLWPKDATTGLPAQIDEEDPSPHPFTGFYLPFPSSDLPDQPIPAPRILGLVSTIPPIPSSSSSKRTKPKLNWVYVDRDTMELKYGPRVEARKHFVGPWDWTSDEEGAGVTLGGEESMVAVEEKRGGLGWAVYWDPEDNQLKGLEIGKKKRVLRCSLERRLVREEEEIVVE
jgi:hypothetical protein